MDEARALCRICLKFEKDDKLLPILSSNSDVALIIYRISGVQVIGSSARPALICQECVNALHAADELRLKCLQADKYFRQAALDHKSPNYDIVFQNVKVELKEESYEVNTTDFQLNDYPIDDVPEELKQERLRETLASNSELQFECDICGVRAESRLSLKRHIWLLHPTSGKKSACRTCGEEFRSQELLMNHERSHFPLLFYCHYCNKGFDRKTSRENHVKAIHEQSTRSPCDIHGCCFVGSTQAVTIRHKNTVHSLIPKNFSCTECPWKFAYKDALARHMRVHTGEKPFKCSNKGCSRAFSDRRGIRNHQASCSCRDPNAKVEFESCDADEYLDKALEKMKREATRPRKPKDKKCFLCSHCSKTFTKEVSMQEHEIIRHSNAEARFECDICGVRTKTSNSIKRHILMVHPASYRRRVCTTCGKEFKSRSLLTAHEVVHQVGTHVCHSCDKTFKRRDALTKHIKIVHDKSTRIPCTFENCSFIASCYTVLVRHRNTVHKMKPKTIPCTECSKTFAYQDGLKSHMRVHTGEKRYKCSNDGCEREFCDKKGLVRHNLNCPYKNTSIYC